MPSKPRRWHPDLDASAPPCLSPFSVQSVAPVSEIAIDFVDLKAVVDRIHAAFFRSPR